MHSNGEAVEEQDSRMQFPNSNASIFVVGGGVRPHVRLSVIRREVRGHWMHQDSRATLK